MRRLIKLTPLIILLLLTFSSLNSFSQSKKGDPKTSKRNSVRQSMHRRDSLLRAFNKSDTSINSLLQRLNQYTTTFNQINNNLSEGLDTADVSSDLPTVIRRINKIDSLTNTRKSGTLRY